MKAPKVFKLSWRNELLICVIFVCLLSLHAPRIKPLSDAVDDLYRHFNSLKEELGKLTSKFDSMEAFVDDLKDGRVTRQQVQRPLPFVGLRSPLRAQMRAPIREITQNRALTRARRRGPKRP